MAIYELVLRQRYFGVLTVNRWNYVMNGTPAAASGAFALISAVGAVSLAEASMIGRIRQLQAVGVNFVDIEARNIYSTTDFYTRPFATGVDGQNAGGNGLSPTVAYGFRTSRVRTDVRRATKRFVGVVENDSGDGGGLSTGSLALMEDIAGYMSDVLTYDDEGNTLSFSPAVCGKEAYTTPSGKTAYRYYNTEAGQLAMTALGSLWEVYDTTRTQVSRQYGRGQ